MSLDDFDKRHGPDPDYRGPWRRNTKADRVRRAEQIQVCMEAFKAILEKAEHRERALTWQWGMIYAALIACIILLAKLAWCN